MSTVTHVFGYKINDVNQSVRRTNVLLRSANALRLTFRDIQHVLEKPTVTNFMWTLVQLSRTYNVLHRLHKLIVFEVNKSAALINLIVPPVMVKPPPMPPPGIMAPIPLSFRTDVFLDNRPVRLDRIDISDLPEKSSVMVQAILEEEAELTVQDAKQILTERILHPEASTGDLGASIGWMNEVFGVRIFANMYYSAWVEEGHDNFAGHHYMADAVARTRLRLPVKLQTQLNGLISHGL